jgi:hypothetical protein
MAGIWGKVGTWPNHSSSSNFRFPSLQLPSEFNGKIWYHHIDDNLTEEILTKIRREFFNTLELSPNKTKLKIEAVMRKNEAPKPPVAHRSTPALQEKHSNRVNAIPKREDSNFKSQLGKRPHLEANRFKKALTEVNLPQRSKTQNFVRESSDVTKKRKIESMNDGEVQEESSQPLKMGKFEATTETNFDSPPNTESTHNLMNVNVKLTFVENAPYNEMFMPQDTFPDDLFNFTDFGNSVDKINAGC